MFSAFNKANVSLYKFIVSAEKVTDKDITKALSEHNLSARDTFKVKDIFFEEIDDLLLASSSSMGALIDISRKVMKKYLGQDFRKKFDETNSAIASNTTGLFIRELRNFIIHGNEVPLGLNHHFDGESGDWTDNYVLSTEPIEAYLHSRDIVILDQFLAENENGIELSPLIYTYNVAMDELWRSFLDDLVKCYRELGGNDDLSRH